MAEFYHGKRPRSLAGCQWSGWCLSDTPGSKRQLVEQRRLGALQRVFQVFSFCWSWRARSSVHSLLKRFFQLTDRLAEEYGGSIWAGQHLCKVVPLSRYSWFKKHMQGVWRHLSWSILSKSRYYLCDLFWNLSQITEYASAVVSPTEGHVHCPSSLRWVDCWFVGQHWAELGDSWNEGDLGNRMSCCSNELQGPLSTEQESVILVTFRGTYSWVDVMHDLVCLPATQVNGFVRLWSFEAWQSGLSDLASWF